MFQKNLATTKNKVTKVSTQKTVKVERYDDDTDNSDWESTDKEDQGLESQILMQISFSQIFL